MMKTECVQLHKLQPEDFTKSFCAQQGISSYSADHCKEMLQLGCYRPAGEVLLQINESYTSGQHKNKPMLSMLLIIEMFNAWQSIIKGKWLSLVWPGAPQ